MRRLTLFFILSLCSMATFGQDQDSIFIDPETPASFPGGLDSLRKFVSKNLRYPHKMLCIEGAVYVQFIVNKDGSLSDAKVIKGLCEPCDKNVLDLFSIMPKWIPGKWYDKPVKTQLILPVKFYLSR